MKTLKAVLKESGIILGVIYLLVVFGFVFPSMVSSTSDIAFVGMGLAILHVYFGIRLIHYIFFKKKGKKDVEI